MPPDGPLEENKHWLLVLKNTVYAAEHLPVCFSVRINTLCFPVKEQLYAADKEQHSDYYQLSMVATVVLHTHKGVYHTFNPPPVSPCTLDTSCNGSVFWSLCRRLNATVAFLPKSPFVLENWGANWRILAKPDTIVLAQPQKLYANMWWEGPSTGHLLSELFILTTLTRGIITLGKWACLFITRKHLYIKTGCDPRLALGCSYQIDPPEEDWDMVCTSCPYLFLAPPGTAQVFYNESGKNLFSACPCRLYIC